MLVLSRKKNESIIINGNIEVKIIESDDGKVRIGIEAPKHIEIHRKEVFDQITEANRAATNSKKALGDLSKLPTINSQKHDNKNSIRNKKLLKK
ncbi:MAG: carbon storage regulator CsrA [Clostridiales bacterium]|nr:carbon storage regulator CsrA [Clostridiales bacterium]